MIKISMKNMNIKFFRKSNGEARLSVNSKNQGDLHSTTRGVLFCCRVLGLLPLFGLTNHTSKNLSYFGQVLMFITTLNNLGKKGMSLNNINYVMFYSMTLISCLVLTRTGQSWTLLMKTVEEPFRKNYNITITITITKTLIMIAGTVEDIFYIFYKFAVVASCNPDNATENYLKVNTPWIFDYTSVNMWKGIVCEKHFSCAKPRREYMKILNLVKVINSSFGLVLLTSVSSNVYWICMKLFYALKFVGQGDKYQMFSLAYFVIRALLVLQFAARIQYNALLPVHILYDLPSSKFGIEVRRYISQIKNSKNALSGLNFFIVARNMILSLVGTILTYAAPDN